LFAINKTNPLVILSTAKDLIRHKSPGKPVFLF
jgi:hypothetical protein